MVRACVRACVCMSHFYTLRVSSIFSVSRLLLKMKIDEITSDLFSVFLEMITGFKGNNNMMLVMELVVDFVMDFVKVKVVIKGVEK